MTMDDRGGRHLQLNSGHKIPAIGLGTWKSPNGKVESAVKTAIAAGYRHIDCAYIYGNEAEVGAAINAKIQDGTIKREDIFVTSKLWNTRHLPGDVKPNLRESLAALGLEYLDLYLMHWPTALKPGKDNYPKDAKGKQLFVDIDYLDTWKAMEECVNEGLVRSIGVSNFNSKQLERLLLEAKIKPSVNQVEVHPYFANTKLVEYCQSRGIVVTAFSPLASPARPWWARTSVLEKRCFTHARSLLDEPCLDTLACALSKTPAQITLRWLYQRGIVAIPKSVNPGRIRENIAIFDFNLSPGAMEIMSSLDANVRLMVSYSQVSGNYVFTDRDAPHFPFNCDF